jgi:hypothetical protein
MALALKRAIAEFTNNSGGMKHVTDVLKPINAKIAFELDGESIAALPDAVSSLNNILNLNN